MGLDAQLRRDIYDLIERFREERRTTLLTTHYIEEAERLCDRVAIIDRGKVIALGTPRELVQQSGKGARIEASFAKPIPTDRLQKFPARPPHRSAHTGRCICGDDGEEDRRLRKESGLPY